MPKNPNQPLPTPSKPDEVEACSVDGGCPPSHRAARRISTFIICFLLLCLLGCGGYMMWTQSL